MEEIFDHYVTKNEIRVEDIPTIMECYLREIKEVEPNPELIKATMQGPYELFNWEKALRLIMAKKDYTFYELYDKTGKLLKRYK